MIAVVDGGWQARTIAARISRFPLNGGVNRMAASPFARPGMLKSARFAWLQAWH